MKTVFITGARRGIGQAVVERFRSSDFEIVSPSREELDLSSTEEIQGYLRRHADLEPDILINNAGENRIFPIEDLSIEYWQRILMINLTAAFMLTRHFAPRMARRRWGRIVNISSVYALSGRDGRAAYTSSKAALNGFTWTSALEFGSANVLVNAVCPGFVETDLTRQNNSEEHMKTMANQVALKRLAQPSEIAEFIYFLASEQNTYITGQALVIDGGFLVNRNL